MSLMEFIMLIIFELIVFGIASLDYMITKQLINPFTIMALPYAIIIPVNNIIFSRYGFYIISNDVLRMLLLGFSMFFLGTAIIRFRRNRIHCMQNLRSVEIDNNYKMKSLLVYCLMVEFVVIIRAIFLIRGKGFYYLSYNEGVLLTGPAGHLLLTIFPVNGVLLYHWLKNKRKWVYLLATLICIGLYFMTFVKYHVIGLVIYMYLLLAYQDKRYVKTGAMMMAAFVLLLFIGNYFLSFIQVGVINQIHWSFYMNHFWKYVAGGMIYDNKIFELGIYNVSVMYRIGTIIFALPNMFLNKFLGVTFFPGISIPPIRVADNGEITNVVDAIGYFYPSDASISEIGVFCVFMMLFGIISAALFMQARRNYSRFPFAYISFITYFLFLSFFGIFAKLETPWEILVWSLIIPLCFDKRITYSYGRIKIRIDVQENGD